MTIGARPVKWPRRVLSAREILEAVGATKADVKAARDVLIACGLEKPKRVRRRGSS